MVERSRRFWSFVGQIKLLVNKFYDVEAVLKAVELGRVSR
jgi:hypothetical protein